MEVKQNKSNSLRFFLFLSFLFLFSSFLYSQTPAFPGAEGGGMYTTGGRGGKVLFVTSLADDTTPGTLRWATDQQGSRTIVFKVSGIISLKKSLQIKNGDLTIAGQTAPGDGICIKDYDVFFKADNIIVRFLRFRLGDLIKDHEPDAFGGRDHKNIIIDHCSSSWSIDECASFYSNENFTMQWCIVSESLNNSEHPKGAHGYGGIWGGKNASFHHNLIAHHNSRNPRFNGLKRSGLQYSNSQDEERVDFRNNVIYNWGSHSSYGGESGNYNIVANYFKYGPATNTKIKDRITNIDKDKDPSICPPGHGKYYIEGNYVSGFPKVTENNWIGVKFSEGLSIHQCKVTNAFKNTTISLQTAEMAYEKVLNYAGASLARDAVDVRIVEDVKTGGAKYKGSTSGIPGLIDNQADVGGWPEYISKFAPLDSNSDGIPDGWLENNYPTKKSLDVNKEGYTYLEVYINSLVDQISTGQKSTIVKQKKNRKK